MGNYWYNNTMEYYTTRRNKLKENNSKISGLYFIILYKFWKGQK